MKFSSVFLRLKGMPSVALLAMACSAFGGIASAAPFTWTGNGGNNLWSTGSNWSTAGGSGTAAVTGSNLVFSGQNYLSNTNNSLTLTTGSISFANTNAANAGFVLNGGSGTLSLSANSRITTAQIITGTGTVLETIASNVRLNGATTLTPVGSSGSFHNLLISGNLINGTGTINNNVTIANGNGGQVFLSGNNTNTGFYIVQNGGILTTLGTSAMNSQSGTNNGTVNVNGGLLKFGPLSGTGVFTTSTTGLQTVQVSSNGNTTFNGQILDGTGTLGLTKSGSGSLTLGGTSGYTGETIVNDGVLAIGVNGQISGSSALTINNSGTFNYGRAANGTFSNALNGSGTSGVFNVTAPGVSVTVASSGNFGGTINTNNSTATFTGTLASAKVVGGPGGNVFGTGTVGALSMTDGGYLSAGLSGTGSERVGKLTVESLKLVDANVATHFDILGTGTAAPHYPGTAGTDYDTIVGTGAIDYGASGSNLVFDFTGGVGDVFKGWSSFQLLSFGSFTNSDKLDGTQLSSFGGAYDNLTFTNADQVHGIFIADAGNGQTVEFYAATGVLMIVPEPSSIILAGLGVGLAGFRTWRNRRLKAILSRAGSKA